MKSNEIRINDKFDIEAILAEVEKVASYNGLDSKSSQRLRLLSEELIGMMPNLMEYCIGKFWVENEGNEYSIHIATELLIGIDESKRKIKELATKPKKYVGIMGKIRSAFEFMCGNYDDTAVDTSVSGYDMDGFVPSSVYNQMWSLNSYKENIEKSYKSGKSEDEWDELEKSIIANLADEVIVGIHGINADIIVKKKF